jgi:predicted AlkP superfamily phosphohydrolase/phosphomutase
VPVNDRRRVLVIGLDSITPVMIEPMLAAGVMPNLAALADRGWQTELTPTMPPSTPTGWATIATGASPATHGVEAFAKHRPGDPLDRKEHCIGSEHVQAEPIWQTAERAGVPSILLKFPMSWPPTGGRLVTQVDGAAGWGGLKCLWDHVHSGCWDTEPSARHAPAGAITQEWATRDEDNLDEEAVQRLEVEPVARLETLPDGFHAEWQATLTLRSRLGGKASVTVLGGRLGDADAVVAGAAPPARRGEWTDWLPLSFGAGAESEGDVRLKVMELDVARRRLRLYQSQVHAREGWTRPESLAGELDAVAGPFVEWTESYDLLQGWIDDETQLDLYRDHVAWMSRAATHVLRTRPWRLFLTQLHVVDMAYHLYWGAVDPRHPQHDAAAAPRYRRLLQQVHRLLDDFVGDLCAQADDDTLVVVLGDHGHDLYRAAFLPNNLLVREGLLTLYRDPRTGRVAIDWSRTQAYASGYRVYLNVQGREPDGVVPPNEFSTVQEQVLACLTAARDEHDGSPLVRLALRREEAKGLGVGGDGMGDVVFMAAPGYQARSSIEVGDGMWIGNRVVRERVPLLRRTVLFREFTGEHDTSLPFERSIRTLMYLAGPGIRHGRRATPAALVDVAPTIASRLGIPAPGQSEGRVLTEAFAPSAPRKRGRPRVAAPSRPTEPVSVGERRTDE